MTKQEAKQYLLGSKIYVAGRSKDIQDKFCKIGLMNCGSGKIPFDLPFFYIQDNGIYRGGYSMNEFSESPLKTVTAGYILDLEIDE